MEELSNFHNGDGICKYLLPNNLCSIYSERPIWCNVDLYYDQFLTTKMTRDEWYSLNEKACLGLKHSERERSQNTDYL